MTYFLLILNLWLYETDNLYRVAYIEQVNAIFKVNKEEQLSCNNTLLNAL